MPFPIQLEGTFGEIWTWPYWPRLTENGQVSGALLDQRTGQIRPVDVQFPQGALLRGHVRRDRVRHTRLGHVGGGDADGDKQPTIQITQHMAFISIDEQTATLATMAPLGIFNTHPPICGDPVAQGRGAIGRRGEVLGAHLLRHGQTGPGAGGRLLLEGLGVKPLLNGRVATADAERAYFGRRASRVKPNRLAASIGTWNLAAGLAGGLPLCHGAGGVTAHYKLGARTAAATLSAGVIFASLGLVLGDSLPALLQLLAPGALAGMLLFVAIQHALLAASLERFADRTIAAGVGAVTIATGNLAFGFAAGLSALGLRAVWSRLATQRPTATGRTA